eukprot:6187047-Pleurochrysis_carterae.AAC.2
MTCSAVPPAITNALSITMSTVRPSRRLALDIGAEGADLVFAGLVEAEGDGVPQLGDDCHLVPQLADKAAMFGSTRAAA